MGHARAMINIIDQDVQLGILKKIINNDLSVRQVEELVRKLNQGGKEETEDKLPLPQTFTMSAETLREKLGSTVIIRRNNNGKGNIVISFESDQDFNRIIGLLD